MKHLLFTLLVISFFACCKKKTTAGLGGNAQLKISVIHHITPIDSCTIFIKFNSLETPADNNYDLQQTVKKDSNGNSFTIFTNLKKGDYYIYGYGFDPTISSSVKGGIPFTIEEEKGYTIVVPVTEVH